MRSYPNADALQQIIAKAANDAIEKARNGIAMRRDHPSYGYTKAMLRNQLYFAQGVVATLALLEGRIGHIHGWDPDDARWQELRRISREINES